MSSLTQLADLGLRFDGPIPAQYLRTNITAIQRLNGTISVHTDMAERYERAAKTCLTVQERERHLKTARWHRDEVARAERDLSELLPQAAE